MNVGLVTFYHIHHYGAVLQAAATVRALESMGHLCEIPDYYVRQDNSLFRPLKGPSAAAADVHTAAHYAALKRRYDRFCDFQSRHLSVTPQRYMSLEELRDADLAFDVVLAGSDQIWNPRIFPDGRFDPVFFGAFSSARKIAYAPSFGLPRLPEGMEEELRDYLKEFTHLSVRERSGAEIVKEAAGRQAAVVLDPTLLPDRQAWEELSSSAAGVLTEKERGGYILCYCVSDPGPLTSYVRRLTEETGLPVVQLCGTRRRVHPKARCVLDAGPAEFLALFRDASFVCTNSFHGTVFSLQFEKPFFTAVSPAELSDPERSRTFDLLRRLGLERRIIGTGATAEPDESVDFFTATAALAREREASLSYLRAALDGVPFERAAEADGAPAPVTLAPHAACTGCTACAAACPRLAISMEPDGEGFAYPRIAETLCVRCGRCTEVCPALHGREKTPLPAAFAAWTRDAGVRSDSTSGGVFSVIAEYVLQSGGVVYGAAMDGNQRLRHTPCFRVEDLWRLRGAKYVQSDMGSVFAEVKEALRTRQVLFTGTPCQVDGLYRFLGERPENLITCDLVCQGVPSPAVWEAVVRDLEQRRGQEIRSVRFRNKVEGWKQSHMTLVYGDGKVDSRRLFTTGYGRAYGRALFLRPCCHACRYTNLTRPGDFTLGDLWGLGTEEFPEEQDRGIGLLLVNTPHGSHIFDQLPLVRRAFPVERAVAGNPRLAKPIAPAPDRAAFFAAFALEPFDRVRRKFLAVPSLPVLAASRILSPEVKEKLRGRLRDG